jgi:hypothetical protein
MGLDAYSTVSVVLRYVGFEGYGAGDEKADLGEIEGED